MTAETTTSLHRVHDMGNNETVITGVVHDDGEWTALTFCKTKTFKTQRGAIQWYRRQTGREPGS